MLVSLKEVLEDAKRKKVAVGAFNTPTLECLLAVLHAAERLNVPVIISHAQIHENVAPLDEIGPVMVAFAKASKVKVCVHLDHGEDFAYCQRAIAHGFTSVMIDYSCKDYEENIKGTAEVVAYAHQHNVDVEAELGKLPSREGGLEDTQGKSEDSYTDPNLVLEYLQRTGVDALAIAFGTAHGIYKVKPVLNLDIIDKITALTDIPLVMHGGSGISNEIYKEVIRRGIRKINYYSYMSYAGYAAAKKLSDEKSEGFFHDMAFAAQKVMEENAYRTLAVFNNLD